MEAKKNYMNSLFLEAQLEGTYSFEPLDKATEEEWLYIGFHVIYLRMETEFSSETLRFWEAYI